MTAIKTEQQIESNQISGVVPSAHPLIDVSVPVSESLPVWPGDPPASMLKKMDMCCGDTATVSELKMGVHTGTHVDAFNHFIHGADGLDKLNLNTYCGKTLVIDVESDVTSAVTLELVKQHRLYSELTTAHRVLFKTKNSATSWFNSPFNPEFVHLHPELAEHLVELGIKVVGVDYLSVESFHAATLYPKSNKGHAPTHFKLMQGGVYIIEGLYLGHTKAGWYNLFCLPVLLHDADGAPARVALQPIDL